MSTLGVDDKVRLGVVWVTSNMVRGQQILVMRRRRVRFGPKSEGKSVLLEAVGNMMSVGGVRLLGSWICQSAACSLCSPWKTASPSTGGRWGGSGASSPSVRRGGSEYHRI